MFKELEELKQKYLESNMISKKNITLWNNLSHERNDYVDLRKIIDAKNGYLGDNII